MDNFYPTRREVREAREARARGEEISERMRRYLDGIPQESSAGDESEGFDDTGAPETAEISAVEGQEDDSVFALSDLEQESSEADDTFPADEVSAGDSETAVLEEQNDAWNDEYEDKGSDTELSAFKEDDEEHSTASAFEESPVTDEDQDDGVVAPVEQKRRKKGAKNDSQGVSKKKLVLIGAGVLLSLTTVVCAGAYFTLTSSVPAAAKSISPEDSEQKVCQPFKDSSLDCAVKYKPTDEPRGSLVSQSHDEGSRIKKGDKVELVYSAGPASSTFPNLKNTELEDAKQQLYAMGIDIEKIDIVDTAEVEEGRVLSTSIAQDTPVKNGDSVTLKVASGSLKVPDWMGKTRDEVASEADKLGLEVEYKEEESTKPANTVIAQSPKKGEFSKDKKVTVTVAKAIEVKDVKVPDVIGKSRKDAQSILASEGFTRINVAVIKSTAVDKETVTQVVPGVGEKAKTDDNIVIIVMVPEKSDSE